MKTRRKREGEDEEINKNGTYKILVRKSVEKREIGILRHR
jgi:hypothetical protein